MMGGGKGGGTKPDYSAAAAADAASAREINAAQTFANRPTINTPWGQQSWTYDQAIDPATGQPVTTWEQNLALSPEQQASLDQQTAIQAGRSGAAGQLLDQATGAFQSPFNWSGLPTAPGQAAQAGNVGDAQKAAYSRMSEMLQPGRNQQQALMDTKLANMGLSAGSEANRRANMQLGDQWGAQDRAMMGQAMQQGTSDVQTQYGMDQSQIAQQQGLRQAGIAEEAQRRGMPLNELNALLTGQQVNMPQMPGFNAAGAAQPPNMLGAAQAQGQFQLGQAQLQQGVGQGIGQLAGTAASAMGMF
jgi:hypothetical protein